METIEAIKKRPGIYQQWELKQHKYSPAFAPWLSTAWESYLAGPRSMRLTPELDDVGVDCGVYFLWDKAGRLLYVGQSVEVQNRLLSHSRNGREHAFASAIEVKAAALDEIEAAYIFALAPPWNAKFRHNGWELHGAMVERIKSIWMGPHRPVRRDSNPTA